MLTTVTAKWAVFATFIVYGSAREKVVWFGKVVMALTSLLWNCMDDVLQLPLRIIK